MPAPNTESALRPEPRSWPLVAAGLIVVAVMLAYANSLTAPFVYDDRTSILYNPSIRNLGALHDLLQPPGNGATVSGRPILNLSFALNYALSGLNVWSYHAANLTVHAALALVLFGLIRRTLAHADVTHEYRTRATSIALGVTLLWALHPLDTEAVTYLAQRAESLMSLFFALTLYGFVRSVDSPRALAWRVMAWLACLLGMATKENMVAAPVAVLLYDRAFVAGSFAAALRLRRWFYLALLSTWLPLGYLVLSTGGNRGGSAGFDVGVSKLGYWLTQFPALVRYALLVVWPHPLVFDYGPFFISTFTAVLLPAAVVIVALAAAVYAFWRHPAAGFLAATALAILAPTSLVPGTTQMIVEHRMYLPLAAVLCLFIPLVRRLPFGVTSVAVLALAVGLGAMTAARNRVYHSELALWHDTAVKKPNNAVARSSFGAALKNAGRPQAALAEHRAALALNPNYAPALANLGIALAESGQPDEALPYVQHAVAVEPQSAQAQLNFGVTLDLLHRPAEALPHYREAVRLMPLMAEAQNDLGDALCRSGNLDQGMQHLRRALELDPQYPDAYFNLAAALARAGRMSDAQATFARGAALRPNDSSAHLTWANFLARQDHVPEALAEYEQAIALAPDAADAHYSYATALAHAHRYGDAVREYQRAIQLRPNYAEAHNNLANTFVALDRTSDAIAEYQQALQLRPNDPTTHNNLGLALARSGRLHEAVEHFAAAVKLAPEFENARQNLAHARAELGL